MLFDSFEAYDVQETRKVRKAEGQQLKLITQVCKKSRKICPSLTSQKCWKKHRIIQDRQSGVFFVRLAAH